MRRRFVTAYVLNFTQLRLRVLIFSSPPTGGFSSAQMIGGSLETLELASPQQGRTAVLQPDVCPLLKLRKRWFSSKIVCDQGWSLSFSGGSRVDRYNYFEAGRHLVLKGEGGSGQMDIFLTATLTWSEPAGVPLGEETRARVLRNITAALQWTGYLVGFFNLDTT